MRVYFDNAATTPMSPKVIEKMSEVMTNTYGNPSAIHTLGRSARAEIEIVRKKVASLLKCDSREIYFLGSGTEADNMALRCAVNDLNVKHIITSPIEHKAVLDTAKDLESKEKVELHLVKLNPEGSADLDDLERLAKKYPNALISLMHANNEVGTLNDLKAISAIARANQCYFHSDTVQTMGHYSYDLTDLDIDFLTCSAHKFHGPKGIGFLYKNKDLILKPIITGGGQESKLRAGTENVMGIVGLGVALEESYENLDRDKHHIQEIKSYLHARLISEFPGVEFNGNDNPDKGLYTVLSVSLPPSEAASTLLFMLDIEGICVSGGSACNSGATGESHVMKGLGHPKDRMAIRFSFSKYNTKQEVDFTIDKLKKLQPIVA